jgi:hypothetical protein
MDINQTRIIELLREVHLIAFKEIERLNMRIAWVVLDYLSAQSVDLLFFANPPHRISHFGVGQKYNVFPEGDIRI